MFYCEDDELGVRNSSDECLNEGYEGNDSEEEIIFKQKMRNAKENLLKTADEAILIKLGKPTTMKRFFDNKQLSDIKLKVGEKVFDAHKLVLVSASDVFETMLMKSDWREASQEEIELHEVDSDVFALVLEFLYTGEIRLHRKKIMSVYQIADKYNIGSVKQCLCIFLHKCVSKQKKLITPQEATEFCNAFAVDALMQPGLKSIIQWIGVNFDKFIESCEWEKLPRSTVIVILQKDEIGGKEQRIFVAAKRWLEFDSARTETPDQIYEVLQHVRLAFLSPMELYAFENDPIVVRCTPMTKLISFTLRRMVYRCVPTFKDICLPENWLTPRDRYYP